MSLITKEQCDSLWYIERAAADWGNWGKIHKAISFLADEEAKAGKRAFVSSIYEMDIKPYTSLVVVLNAGVETACHYIGATMEDKPLYNLKKRLKRQTRTNGEELLRLLDKIHDADASNTQSLVTSYADSTDRSDADCLHIRSQLAAFSPASVDELRRSLAVKKERTSSLASVYPCYPEEHLAQRKAEDAWLKRMKNKFTEMRGATNNNPPIPMKLAPLEHPEVDSLFALAVSSRADDRQLLSGGDGDSTYGDNDCSCAEGEDSSRAEAITDKRHLDQATSATSSQMHPFKRARYGGNADCANLDALSLAANEQLRLEGDEELQERKNDLDRRSAALEADRTALLRMRHVLEDDELLMARAQSDMQALQIAHENAVQAHAKDVHTLQVQQEVHKAAAQRLVQDQHALKVQQGAHKAVVQAHVQRVAQEQRSLQDQQAVHQAAVLTHTQKVAKDFKNLFDKQGLQEEQDKKVAFRRTCNQEWENRLQNKDRLLSQRENDLNRREEVLNSKEDKCNQWEMELGQRQAELDQREDNDRISQSADAGDLGGDDDDDDQDDGDGDGVV